MRLLLFVPLLLYFHCKTQTIQACKKRFDTYLNFHGSLDSKVRFTSDRISVQCPGGSITVYADELTALSAFFSRGSQSDQLSLLKSKGSRHLGQRELDSLMARVPASIPRPKSEKPLEHVKIALDPGHFSADFADARIEQKFLFFGRADSPGDTVRLIEGELTFHTASILTKMLEDEGATVMSTRQGRGLTAFGCTYRDWMMRHKKRVLDSLVATGAMAVAKRNVLLKAPPAQFFLGFFKDHELSERARRINAFGPDLCVIIHYNVDEKNIPWNKQTPKNFAMTFIGGAFTGADVCSQGSLLHFLRFLLTPQLEKSQELAQLTVNSFNKLLGIPVARPVDATYLTKNCLMTTATGVYSRNLAMCRKVTCPLVYGESLYQDNLKEALELMKAPSDIYGMRANVRMATVARSYFEAVMAFVRNN